MSENRFNLIDEPWIPVVDVGRVSLKEIFSNPNLKALGGNPVQKIALTKLLLAIAQSANTPTDDQAWKTLGSEGLAKACLAYLEKWHDRFYLYGEKPFLQMPELANKVKKEDKNPNGFVLSNSHYPAIPSNNGTVLTSYEVFQQLNNADLAIFLVTQMNMALKSSAVIKKIEGKKDISYANPGPSVGSGSGYLHSFFIGNSIIETIWLNLQNLDSISLLKVIENGLGKAPWELESTDFLFENNDEYKKTYLSRLIGLSRFVLVIEDDKSILITNGLLYPSHKEGWDEFSVAFDRTKSEYKPMWLSMNKRPWRQLDSLLSFMESQSNKQQFDCLNLRIGFRRINTRTNSIGIWSGGLKVSADMKDQKCKGDDDFVESFVMLPPPNQTTGSDSTWFANLQTEMSELNELEKILGASVYACNKRQIQESKERDKRADAVTNSAKTLFWQLCESRFQELIFKCEKEYEDERIALRKVFAGFVLQAFENYCPKETARQLDAWAQSRPNLSKYLAQPNKEVA